MKYARACIAAVLGTAALIEFIFWGGSGIGLTLLFLILLAAYYIACGFPRENLRHTLEHAALAVLIAALALCYTLFANESLLFINFAVLVFLMGLLFLQGTVGKSIAWDRTIFQAELWTGYFIRPFVCLARPVQELKELRAEKKSNESGEAASAARSAAKKKILFQILAALLAAVPLLIILISLLSSADPVFRDVFKPLNEWLASLRISEVAAKVILFLFLLPFTASTVWSYRDSFSLFAKPSESSSVKTCLLPPASAITLLGLVNAVYLLYAGVQFAYIFGAFSGRLPDGLTPAQYARNGFFELAFISCINVVLLLASIKLTRREGKPGLVIRCLSTALLVLSLVQLISAMLRMRLYILTFGFTQLRYFVSAFMILLAVYFVFLGLREFITSFPLFRCMVFAGAAALVILNYSVPDAQIARYNLDHYRSGQLAAVDMDYLYSLSADAQNVIFESEAALSPEETVPQSTELQNNEEENAVSNDYAVTSYRTGNWKMYNVSREKYTSYLSNCP